MTGHSNLSPRLNQIIQTINDPGSTLDLHNLNIGDAIRVVAGDREIDMLDLEIVQAPPNLGSDSKGVVYASLPGKNWSEETEKEKVIVNVQGTGTFNPASPVCNLTMVSLGSITIGRNLLLIRVDERLPSGNFEFITFKKPVVAITVKKATSPK